MNSPVHCQQLVSVDSSICAAAAVIRSVVCKGFYVGPGVASLWPSALWFLFKRWMVISPPCPVEAGVDVSCFLGVFFTALTVTLTFAAAADLD